MFVGYDAIGQKPNSACRWPYADDPPPALLQLGVGVASFVALFYATFAACGDDNSRCINKAAPLILGAPAAAGGVVGYLVRYKGWHSISLEQLQATLQRAARKEQP